MVHRPSSSLPTNLDLKLIIERTRDQSRKSIELLRQSWPDTFLGRRTQEPFPSGDARSAIRVLGGSSRMSDAIPALKGSMDTID